MELCECTELFLLKNAQNVIFFIIYSYVCYFFIKFVSDL